MRFKNQVFKRSYSYTSQLSDLALPVVDLGLRGPRQSWKESPLMTTS